MTEELPEGWAWATLESLLSEKIINGRSVPTREGGFPVLRLNAIKRGKIDPSVSKEGAWEESEAAPYLLRAGDFLLSRGNGTLSLVGRGGLVAEDAQVAFPDTMMRIRVNPYVLDANYFCQLWNSPLVRDQVESSARTTAGIYKVNQGILRAIKLPVPPLDEQLRIVALLDSGLSRMQAVDRHLERALRLSYALGKSIRSNALDCDSEAIQGKIGDLLDRIEAGKSFACEPRPAGINEWGVVKVSAMTWGEFREGENKAISAGRSFDPNYEIRSGDILVSRANTREYVGAPVLVSDVREKLLLSDKSLRLIPKSGVDKDWLIQVLASPRVRGQISDRATGTKDSMRNISQNSLMGVEVGIPEYSRQRELASSIRDRLRDVARLQDAILAAQARSEQLYRSLLVAAFTGELVPQDPSDEPASELLGRIHAEHAAVSNPKRGNKAKASTALKNPVPVAEESQPVPAGEQIALEI